MGVKHPRRMIVALLPAIALIAACAPHRPRPAPVDAGVFWPTYLGNYARTPFLHERIGSERPEVLWTRSVGSGIEGMPIATDEVIVTARSDKHIETISRLDGSTFWRKQIDGPPVSPLLIGDVIYTATEEEGEIRALRLQEGDDVWRRNTPSVDKPISVVGDTVYAATEDRIVLAITSEPDPVWSIRLPRKASAGPVVIEDILVLVAFDSLFALDRSNGARRGAAHSREVFVGEAASDGEAIYLATEDGSLVAWKMPELEPFWRASGFGHFLTGPVLADGMGYAATQEGQLIRFDPATGAAKALATMKGAVLAEPTVVGNGILVGTLNGYLYFYSRDGEPIWELQLDGSIENPIVVHEGRIIVPLYSRVDGPLGSSNLKGRLMELR